MVLKNGRTLAPVTAMLQLPATITHPAAAPLPSTLAQMFEQSTAALLIRVDVAIDPFVACQSGAAGDLLRAQVPSEQGIDPFNPRRIDTVALTGTRPPLPTPMLGLHRIVDAITAAALDLAADRADVTPQHPCNASQGHAALERGVDTSSFFLIQMA